MTTINVSESFLLVETLKSREHQTLSSDQIVDVGKRSTQDKENTRLQRRHPKTSQTARFFRSKFKTRCCVKSKSGILILLWTSLISLSLMTVLNQNLYLSIGSLLFEHRSIVFSIQVTPPVVYSLFAILYLFYPLAGCLADIRCGRYKTVVCSLWSITGSGLALFTCIMILISTVFIDTHQAKITLIITFGLVALLSLILTCSSYIAFDANVIQFGMDQLHDSPTEDSVLFIHWFVFSSSLGNAVTRVPSSWITARCWHSFIGFSLLALVLVALLGVSLCIARWKRQWFLIDSASRNPYKLVYKVIRFAAQHKIPIRRSAFTYCEDELPSRMDLGKDKYGGPFTTEQVEDVKAFLGILCILLTLGPTFTINTAVNRLLNTVPHHFTVNNSCTATNYLVQAFKLGHLSTLIIVILVPTYIYLLRPFIERYIPGMLKRIGIGMMITSVSLICTLVIDTAGHAQQSHKVCFTKINTHPQPEDKTIDPMAAYYIIPLVLNGIGDMLIYIGAYEFMCAQSPHAMKGLIIGIFYAIKGVSQLIAAMVIFVPFYMYRLKTNLPSCGFVYYLVNVVIALTGLVAYTCVARRYQYRQRDEPDNIYRYAEDYYDRDRDDSYQSSYKSV